MTRNSPRGPAARLGPWVFGLAAATAGCMLADRPRYAPPAPPVPAAPGPDPVARGRAVASVLCAHCHADPANGAFSGRKLEEIPPILARDASASNLTADPDHGIGRYSDAELVTFLRTGVKRDGRLGDPWAPRFPLLSDADAAAVIAFLRSDDPAVRPVPRPVPPARLGPVGRVLVKYVARPLPPPTGPVPDPDPGDEIALGRYVVLGKAQCYGCHSAGFGGLDELRPERSRGFLGGGNRLVDMAGREVRSANLTPDAETGIGRWTEDQFVRAVREGIRPDGRPLRAPMLPYRDLTETEVRAAFSYLRTVPALRHRVKARPASPPPNLPAEATPEVRAGAVLYARYECRACHGDRGAGYGDLPGAGRRYASDGSLAAWIADPAAHRPGAKMPTFAGVIAPAEYAPLVAYVRSLARATGR